MSIQDRAVTWHTNRFPDAAKDDVLLKAVSEIGEVSDAMIADNSPNPAHPERAGNVLAESADVVVCLLILCGRYGYGDLIAATEEKLSVLEKRLYDKN